MVNEGNTRFHQISVAIARLAEHGTSRVGKFSNSGNIVCGAVTCEGRQQNNIAEGIGPKMVGQD